MVYRSNTDLDDFTYFGFLKMSEYLLFSEGKSKG